MGRIQLTSTLLHGPANCWTSTARRRRCRAPGAYVAQPLIRITLHTAEGRSGGSDLRNGQGARSTPVTSTPDF